MAPTSVPQHTTYTTHTTPNTPHTMANMAMLHSVTLHSTSYTSNGKWQGHLMAPVLPF
jgi:hypothetical protein